MVLRCLALSIQCLAKAFSAFSIIPWFNFLRWMLAVWQKRCWRTTLLPHLAFFLLRSVFGKKSVVSLQRYCVVWVTLFAVQCLAKTLLAYIIVSFSSLPFAFSVWQKSVVSLERYFVVWLTLFAVQCLAKIFLAFSIVMLFSFLHLAKALSAFNIIPSFSFFHFVFSFWQKCCRFSTISHRSAFFIWCSLFSV